MGAISKNQFFHRVFPEFLREKNLHINCLELLTISIAMKIWGKQFGGKKVYFQITACTSYPNSTLTNNQLFDFLSQQYVLP
jgi:hypothetical protein